jgi:hypothetical protein
MLNSCQVPLTQQQKQYFNINSGVVVTNVQVAVFLIKMNSIETIHIKWKAP